MKRLLTALVLAPAVTYAVLGPSPWLFLAAVAAVAVASFREYSAIIARYGIAEPGPVAYAAGILVIVVPARETLLLTLIAMLALSLAMRMKDLSRALPWAAAFMLGVLYIFGPWRCAVELRSISPHWLFFALALNWVGDTAAYYVGSAFGRHKLAPVVSPKKSWEGAAASLAASAAFGAAYLHWALPAVAAWEVAALAAVANVAGQLGDLAESALKRGAGVKDSGNSVPGHGGWLDRVDSSLFAVPVVLLLLTLFSKR